ncbi:MAG: Glu/Leu/Phe/Val dehydrogenase [Saprospiraceae bacterium]|jgi:glutamate dehydrogenase/leucine dehydrogenase|nr:Glu/Leu/Phe/Val dehydrogenase [Saprospiraceae bacterium]
MSEMLEKYKNKKPEIIFEWNDELTDARGWVVINSLRNGAAGGGTRMRKGLTRDEVTSLAKVMEIKFSVSGPSIGGAKSGIDFDPADPRKEEVLKRWFKAVFPLLKNYYGTGGDLNVDEIKDVIPITEELGLWHPQEGVVNGHFGRSKGDAIKMIGQLRYGCSKTIEDRNYVLDGSYKYAIADMITGWGVSESVRHFYHIYKNIHLSGKTAIIQGWGNVASAAALYLAKNGVKIVGIIDRDGGIINKKGMSFDDVKTLFINKQGNKLKSKDMRPFDEVNQEIWSLGADIFVPGAASKIVTRKQAEQLINGNIEVIACGANVPFEDDGIFFGETAHILDKQTALIPDFISNCGMARVFAYLMQPEVVMSDQAIFEDVSDIIRKAIEEVYQNFKEPVKISENSLNIALNKLLS